MHTPMPMCIYVRLCASMSFRVVMNETTRASYQHTATTRCTNHIQTSFPCGGHSSLSRARVGATTSVEDGDSPAHALAEDARVVEAAMLVELAEGLHVVVLQVEARIEKVEVLEQAVWLGRLGDGRRAALVVPCCALLRHRSVVTAPRCVMIIMWLADPVASRRASVAPVLGPCFCTLGM